ncbi:unnamed protein product [Adineta ricciae]|uniref:Kinesin light chain n=1 Tax=Adineta ricciae TaxID=249248 RepID=A0A815B116_ADIRI|nr:unnamed protein product [Adineta ricciae]CAF1341236.1 unnamed protein product [Adineta ricciae]
MLQNYRLVWLDNDIDNVKCYDSIAQLRSIVNTIDIFNDIAACFEHIESIKDETLALLVSNKLGEKIIPTIHKQSNITAIFIFSQTDISDNRWMQKWWKIHGVFHDISSVCQALKSATYDYNQSTIAMNCSRPNRLDHDLIYTFLLKEILSTIKFEHEHKREFLKYCREQYVGNSIQLKKVDQLQTDYRRQDAIAWYTHEGILYSMLNDALRTLNVDLVLKMGFFINDLHEQIVTLHLQQHGNQQVAEPLTVFRSQGVSHSNFDLLMRTRGGVLSFNNFLYTDKNRAESLDFARRTMTKYDVVGVLFIVTVDSATSKTPFVNIHMEGEEEQVLFSMHSIFRVDQMKQINGNNRLWQVELSLMDSYKYLSDDSIQHVRKEIEGSTEWVRIGKLMVKLGQYDLAESLYRKILLQTNQAKAQADLLYQLGCIYCIQGKYFEALASYEKVLRMRDKLFSSKHPSIAKCYNDIAIVYGEMNEISTALFYSEKAIEIFEIAVEENPLDLANAYEIIGVLCSKRNDYSNALAYYGKALRIYQRTLPANDPQFANLNTNIGSVYARMSEYLTALTYFEKALEIQSKSLPSNHPDLAFSYGHIGLASFFTGNHSNGLSYCQRALEVAQQSLPANHPHIEIYKANLNCITSQMNDTAQE